MPPGPRPALPELAARRVNEALATTVAGSLVRDGWLAWDRSGRLQLVGDHPFRDRR